MEKVNASIAAFEAIWIAASAVPSLEPIDPMLMIRPPRGITGTTFCIRNNGPYTFTVKVFSMDSFDAFSAGPGNPIAALLTIEALLRQKCVSLFG